jgi:mannosyltransferase OCH1-like enzyme
MNSWKINLHDYEFVLWNFDRFDINNSRWVKEAFEAKKYAFAADFIRLYAVYNFGGIYLDMDIEVIKPFDELLGNSIMIAFENDKRRTVEAGCFGAEQGSLYIKQCLDHYENRSFVRSDGYHDILPLPQIMKQKLRELSQCDIVFYTSDYFTANTSDSKIINITNNTYCIHHFAGSWLSERDKQFNYIKSKILIYLGKNVVSWCMIRILFFIKRIQEVGFIEAIKYYNKRLISPDK